MFTSRTRNIQYFIDYQKSQKSHKMEKKNIFNVSIYLLALKITMGLKCKIQLTMAMG